jgi:soluble lytic murein transglycosylase-like protein
VIDFLSIAAITPMSATVAAPVNASKHAAYRGGIDDAVHEASLRFGVPEIWIKAVINAESAGNRAAVSPKGAKGLMQLMPDTWHELREKHGLGEDVFNTRDNILAGTAYLRFLFDRFGMEGFVAAYNAGPKRYEDHLQKGKTLPVETQIYVQRVRQLLGARLIPAASTRATRPEPIWSSAPLFASPEQAPTGSTPTPLTPQTGPFVDLNLTPSTPLK